MQLADCFPYPDATHSFLLTFYDELLDGERGGCKARTHEIKGAFVSATCVFNFRGARSRL